MWSISAFLIQQPTPPNLDPMQMKSNFKFSVVLVIVCLVILIGLWLIDVLPYFLKKDQ